MKIAILGTRGVPPAYGGFETFAAELGMRLVKRGHEVTVYCRRDSGFAIQDSSPSPVSSLESRVSWNGIQRIELPAIAGKYFETVSHTFLSAIDSLRRGFDVILLCNAANAFTIPLLRAARLPVAINVDGIERRRRKWNVLGQTVYLIGEAFSASFADRVVADAEVIAEYYEQHFGVGPAVIPYGSDFPDENDSDVLQRLGLERRNYILYVSRFEPENNPLEVVKACEGLSDAPPLVMVGDARYAIDLKRQLLEHRSDRILFPGALYGPDYRTLQRHALIYIQATEVGGTHPALIEAMRAGGCVLAHDTPENREVGGDSIRYFEFRPAETLSQRVRELLADAPCRERMRERAKLRAGARYSWEAVTEAYEHLFWELAGMA
ncbi:MAG TPA: glycosyltransferase [Thermoanaerobaculia bacterium]|nr:glycosyltransferase [Thermoanaerobaculia bacterium]